MLKKANRLNHTEFARYFAEGKRFNSAYSTVIHYPVQDFKCAVVVGKKICKKAHDRNLIKRRFYEVIGNISRLRRINGVYIFLVKSNVKDLTKKDFIKNITLEIGRILK